MKRDENNKQNYIKIILAIAFLIAVMAVYSVIISDDIVELEIAGIVASGIVFIMNAYYIFNNKKLANQSRKLIKRKEVEKIEKSPLEVYLVSAIWYHKKIHVNKAQICSEIIHEIGKGNLLLEKNTLKISKSFNLKNLTSVQSFLLDSVFLDPISFKQSYDLKIEKLKHMQEEEEKVSLVDIEFNMTHNLQDKSRVYDLVGIEKEKYFEEDASTNSAFLTIISMLFILLNLITTFSFIGNASIYNFYMPIVLAVLLVAAITNKNRECVSIDKKKVEEVSEILNYAKGLASDKKSKVYLCSLGLLSKEEEDKITKIFHVE